jgi:signal transduction histidine kinase
MVDLPRNPETRQLEVLVRVSSLLSTLDIDRVLSEVVRLTAEVVGATKGSFFLLNDRGRGLSLQRFLSDRNYNPDEKQYISDRILTEGLAGWVIENREATIVQDTLTDPRWLTMDEKTLGARSALCLPFISGEKIFGILTMEHPEPHHFSEADKRLAVAVANQAGAAMRNAQLFDQTQTQQHQMEAVLNSTVEALFTVEKDGTIGLINQAAEDVLGLRADSAVGMVLDDLMPYSNVLTDIVNTIRARATIGGAQSFEINDPNTRRDYVVSVSVVSTQNSTQSNGQANGQNGQSPNAGEGGFVVSLHDVSSLKDLTRLKTHLLHMASHDLKNPLGVLLGYLDMMREDAQNGIVPDPGFVDGMFRAVERMEALIQTLLSQERIEAQGAHIRQRIDPATLLNDVVNDMMPSINAKKHDVVLDIGESMAVISGDPVELREAMGNLVSNAIKYTPEGGRVTINMKSEDNRLYFSVIDTGLGIPADQQNMIFNKYFRAKNAATAEIEGTGLGLSLVKTVVEAHGGKVWFQSEEGAGSTFGFWLPVLTA